MLFGSDLTFFAGIPHYKTLFKQLLLVFFMPINDECFLLKLHPRTLKKDHFSRSNTHTRDCSTSTKRGAITISVFQIWTVLKKNIFFCFRLRCGSTGVVLSRKHFITAFMKYHKECCWCKSHWVFNLGKKKKLNPSSHLHLEEKEKEEKRSDYAKKYKTWWISLNIRVNTFTIKRGGNTQTQSQEVFLFFTNNTILFL